MLRTLALQPHASGHFNHSNHIKPWAINHLKRTRRSPHRSRKRQAALPRRSSSRRRHPRQPPPRNSVCVSDSVIGRVQVPADTSIPALSSAPETTMMILVMDLFSIQYVGFKVIDSPLRSLLNQVNKSHQLPVAAFHRSRAHIGEVAYHDRFRLRILRPVFRKLSTAFLTTMSHNSA
jgi:hypothetical protein